MIDLAQIGFTGGSDTERCMSNAGDSLPLPVSALRPGGFEVGDRVVVLSNAYDLAEEKCCRENSEYVSRHHKLEGYFGKIIETADRGIYHRVILLGSKTGDTHFVDDDMGWLFESWELDHVD